MLAHFWDSTEVVGRFKPQGRVLPMVYEVKHTVLGILSTSPQAGAKHMDIESSVIKDIDKIASAFTPVQLGGPEREDWPRKFGASKP